MDNRRGTRGRDTTCAITAGVVAARTGLTGIPPTWLDFCEPLPDWTPGPGIRLSRASHGGIS
jgi:hypothetical protein